MRILLFLIFILILSGCSSVKVAKEITKATSSIKTSVKKIINNEEKIKKKLDISELSIGENEEKYIEIIDTFAKKKETLNIEKKKEKKLFREQKKIIKINFLGKTLKQLKSDLGEPQLIRFDGNTKTARFDTKKCRLFLFFNSIVSVPRVEHFEIRDIKGNLINTKEKIQICYKDFQLI